MGIGAKSAGAVHGLAAGPKRDETDASFEREQRAVGSTMTWPNPARRIVSVGSHDSIRTSKSKVESRLRAGRADRRDSIKQPVRSPTRPTMTV